MSHTHAAEKAQRQTAKRTGRNRTVKERIKDAIKNLGTLLASKKIAEAREALPKFYKLLDKSAKQHVLHKNKAARIKSAWMKKVSAVK